MALKDELTDRIAIGSLELSKSLAYFCVAKELESKNRPLTAYSLYYSIFHAAQFRLLIEKKFAFEPDNWIAASANPLTLMKWSTPWQHNQVLNKLKTSKIESDFIDLMENAKNLREFYSYGPKIIRDTKEKNHYFVYISEYQEIANDIEKMVNDIENWYTLVPKIVKDSLLEENQTYCFQFAYYLWTGGGGYLKSYEFSSYTNALFKEIVEKTISSLEESCKFVMKRDGWLKLARA